MITSFRRGGGHGHDDGELGQAHEREELRRHLVDAHHWPAVARYDATAADLDELHVAMHDPARLAEARRRAGEILDPGVVDALPVEMVCEVCGARWQRPPAGAASDVVASFHQWGDDHDHDDGGP